ncbi:MAG: hypothetical protein ABL932_06085 [Terricaulis sp.]
MAEPAKRIDLKVVNEDYAAPAGATPHQQLEAKLASAIKEGRRRANADLSKRVDEAVSHQLKGVRTAHEDELSRIADRERAIGHHRAAWLYGIPALIMGGVIALWGFTAIQNYTAATLAGNFREQAMTGAIIQANQAPRTCIPGEHLDDGRVCPRTTDTRVGP